MQLYKTTSLYIFYGLLAYMPLHIFLSTWLGTSFGILDFAKIFKDTLLVCGFLCALVASIRTTWFKAFMKDRLIWIIVAYAALTLLLALLKSTDSDAEILGIVYNLRFLLFFLYGSLLVRLFEKREVFKTACKVVLVVAIPVFIFGILQYFVLQDSALIHFGYSRDNGVLPAFFIDDKPDLERVMSTVRDPNSFGSYIIIILSLAAASMYATKNKNIRQIAAGIFLLGALCLVFTFSRSAWLGAVLAGIALLIVVILNKQGFKLSKRIVACSIGVLLLLLLLVIPFRNTYFMKNVIFHADESTVLEDPNELRTRFWQESLEAAAKEPFGHGPGTAGLASIRNDKQGTVLNENYYLQILHEVGFLGLILFSTIIIIVLMRLYNLGKSDGYTIALWAALFGLIFTNLLVHIWSNEAVAYTFWGLAGTVCFVHFSNQQKIRKQRGKTN